MLFGKTKVLAGADYQYLMPSECVGFSKNLNFLREDIPAFSANKFVEKVISCFRHVRREVGMEGCINPPTTLDALSTIWHKCPGFRVSIGI